MIPDSFYLQGSTHEICEDYALHYRYDGNDPKCYAVIADGCSNGGGPKIDSDWGARFLCKAAGELMPFHKDEFDHHFRKSQILHSCYVQKKSIPELHEHCLTATLWAVHSFSPQTSDKRFRVFGMGDGFYGVKDKAGIWTINQIEFPSNAPFYLTYLDDDESGAEQYFEKFGSEYIKRVFQGPITKLESINEEKCKINLDKPFFVEEYGDEYDIAFVGSDGLSSFHESIVGPAGKFKQPVPFQDVLGVLFDFVNFRPSFLRIQKNWAFKQDKVGTFVRRKWQPFDDVSVGMIYAND